MFFICFKQPTNQLLATCLMGLGHHGPGGRCHCSSKGSSAGSQHPWGGTPKVQGPGESYGLFKTAGVAVFENVGGVGCCTQSVIFITHVMAYLHIYTLLLRILYIWYCDDCDSHVGFSLKADTTAPLPWVQIRLYQFVCLEATVKSSDTVHCPL